jgi:hypothetical protein
MLKTLIQKWHELFQMDRNNVNPFFETPFILEHIHMVKTGVDIFLFIHIHARVSTCKCISGLPIFPHSSNTLPSFVQENI